LNEQVLLLSKKHGQLKQAITKMVQVVMGFLDDAPSMEKKMQTIETLRTVTEGKVGRQNLAIVRHAHFDARYLSRLNEPELHVYSRTSRRTKVTSMQQPTFCVNYK
jgi:hypothetical protein